MKTIFKVEIGGLPIRIEQARTGAFRVVYWKQRASGLSYRGAAHEFGECVMHALQCEGLTDET